MALDKKLRELCIEYLQKGDIKNLKKLIDTAGVKLEDEEIEEAYQQYLNNAMTAWNTYKVKYVPDREYSDDICTCDYNRKGSCHER